MAARQNLDVGFEAMWSPLLYYKVGNSLVPSCPGFFHLQEEKASEAKRKKKMGWLGTRLQTFHIIKKCATFMIR